MFALIKNKNGLYKIIFEKDICKRLSSEECLIKGKSGKKEAAELLTITRM